MLTKNYLAIYAKSFNWAGFFLPSFMWMSSKVVAEQAFNETMKGKDLYINGGINKFLALLMWLTPKWLTNLYYKLIMRKRP